ncbi:type II secretion system inner membrane protein GspF [Cellvibrio japonicus]|uniref:General secretion pathway protein F n=1 Tax=Cellvibrio japonicus (strain Ueda107) TaxID=498211 RepID=B3PF16_CELJU|nr:type II secretion system inner membrane protein GspF [Cellvibrio japonicus]ACE85466.1 General secretion pathway protein F [Cellvibrio japonicus Ueda107]QEI13577.1 type II secretion system protein GspF [Cellvibrio japonicus]QEI17151.1 type II secretion system protein GspF [Cellvibrio japonicus]QEI20728.1 type II secretion system protein GspF [Cellvibrio japonicus]
MGAYSYKALNEDGKTVKGILEGDSERHIRAQLRAKKLKPLEVLSSSAESAANSENTGLGGWGRRRAGKLSVRDLSLITRQLASLVRSGLPLDEALQATAKQSQKANVKRVVLQVRTRVLEGFSLAQAMGDNPGAFNDMYRALVRAGEGSGYLSPVLERLADYTQTSQQLQQRIKMAMIYPVVMLMVSIGVIVALMVWVVPKLVKIFEQGGRELPMLTQALIACSEFLQNYGVVLFIAIIAVYFGIQHLLRDPKRLRAWHVMQLKLPVIGELVKQINSSRFAATLSLLSASGVPLLQALNISGQVMTNKVMQEACDSVAAAVREGTSLNRAMENSGAFPPLLVQLVASGETNGTLPQQLDNAARDQERELEMMLGVAMGLLEPATIIFMGGAVCLIVLAILTPIFEMTQMAS